MKLHRIARIAVAAALAALLVSYAGFRVPILFPSFLKVDLGDAPALLIGAAMGFAAGFWTELVKILLHLVLHGGDVVSDLANLVAGTAFLLPLLPLRTGLPTRRRLGLPLLAAPLAAALIMIPANGLVFLPYHGILGAAAWKMAVLTLGPFNLLKFGLSALAVYLSLPFLAPVLGVIATDPAPAAPEGTAGTRAGD